MPKSFTVGSTPRYNAPTLPVYLLSSLIERLSAWGMDVQALCEGSGCDVQDFSDPMCRISIRQAVTLIRRAIQAVPDRALGLETGLSETITSIGLLGYAMLTSPTMKEAIKVGINMQKQSGALMHFDVVENSDRISIMARSMIFDDEIETFLTEEAFSCFMKLACVPIGSDFRPVAVELSYTSPRWSSRYEEIFQCPVRFECDNNSFQIAAADGDRTIPTHDVLAHRQVVELLRQANLAQDGISEFTESIERVIRRNLNCVPTLLDLAEKLNIGERTLRRRLATSGTSYQAIVDNARRKQAVKLLRDSSMSIERVAEELGFSDAHNFRRAFKRWTGRTPRQVL